MTRRICRGGWHSSGSASSWRHREACRLFHEALSAHGNLLPGDQGSGIEAAEHVEANRAVQARCVVPHRTDAVDEVPDVEVEASFVSSRRRWNRLEDSLRGRPTMLMGASSSSASSASRNSKSSRENAPDCRRRSGFHGRELGASRVAFREEPSLCRWQDCERYSVRRPCSVASSSRFSSCPGPREELSVGLEGRKPHRLVCSGAVGSSKSDTVSETRRPSR